MANADPSNYEEVKNTTLLECDNSNQEHKLDDNVEVKTKEENCSRNYSPMMRTIAESFLKRKMDRKHRCSESILGKYFVPDARLLCEFIKLQFENRQMPSDLADGPPVKIDWCMISQALNDLCKIEWTPWECQRLWKYMAYQRRISTQNHSNLDGLYSDSEIEDITSTTTGNDDNSVSSVSRHAKLNVNFVPDEACVVPLQIAAATAEPIRKQNSLPVLSRMAKIVLKRQKAMSRGLSSSYINNPIHFNTKSPQNHNPRNLSMTSPFLPQSNNKANIPMVSPHQKFINHSIPPCSSPAPIKQEESDYVAVEPLPPRSAVSFFGDHLREYHRYHGDFTVTVGDEAIPLEDVAQNITEKRKWLKYVKEKWLQFPSQKKTEFLERARIEKRSYQKDMTKYKKWQQETEDKNIARKSIYLEIINQQPKQNSKVSDVLKSFPSVKLIHGKTEVPSTESHISVSSTINETSNKETNCLSSANETLSTLLRNSSTTELGISSSNVVNTSSALMVSNSGALCSSSTDTDKIASTLTSIIPSSHQLKDININEDIQQDSSSFNQQDLNQIPSYPSPALNTIEDSPFMHNTDSNSQSSLSQSHGTSLSLPPFQLADSRTQHSTVGSQVISSISDSTNNNNLRPIDSNALVGEFIDSIQIIPQNLLSHPNSDGLDGMNDNMITSQGLKRKHSLNEDPVVSFGRNETRNIIDPHLSVCLPSVGSSLPSNQLKHQDSDYLTNRLVCQFSMAQQISGGNESHPHPHLQQQQQQQQQQHLQQHPHHPHQQQQQHPYSHPQQQQYPHQPHPHQHPRSSPSHLHNVPTKAILANALRQRLAIQAENMNNNKETKN